MKKVYLFLLMVCIFLFSCDRQLKTKIRKLEERLSNVENKLSELLPENRPTTYLRVKTESNVRTSPEKGNNLLGRIIKGNYVQKLETKGEWIKIRILASNKIYEGYIYSSLVEEVEIGEFDYLERVKYNHFFLTISPSIKRHLKRYEIGLRGSATLGLLIESEGGTKKQLRDKVIHFFVNFDPKMFKVKLVDSVNFEKHSTVDCIAVVDIRDEKNHSIKIYDRSSSIIFHQFVDFNIVE